MRRVPVALAHFWEGFGPDYLFGAYPFLEPRIELVDDARAELVLSSCFVDGRKAEPELPLGRYARVFLTHENVRPDPERWDFSFSFARGLEPTGAPLRHFRLPNHVPVQWRAGFAAGALLRDPLEDLSPVLERKSRFCAFLQANPVPFREDFVRRLSRYRPVDCAGPRLNNVGRVVSRAEKHRFLESYKFVVAFENEASPGYVTEKLTDALLARSLPLYWGDPEVDRDFSPGAFLWLRPGADVEEFVERVVALDGDDAAYADRLRAPVYPGNRLPPHADPAVVEGWFERVLEAVPGILTARVGLPGWEGTARGGRRRGLHGALGAIRRGLGRRRGSGGA